MIKYHWLHRDELEVLEPVLDANGWASLNKPTSCAIAAFDGDNLVGFFVLQPFPMAGPMWTRQTHRGTGIAEDLAAKMSDFMRDIQIRGFLVIADSAHSEQMCKSRGMRRVESPVYIA